jgi:hypothetical protein
VDVLKAQSYDAGQMLPYMYNAHCWELPAPAANQWYLAKDNSSPFPGGTYSVGTVGWRMLFGAGSAAGGDPLVVPLTGIPHGARLRRAQLSYSVDGAGMHSLHYFRVWLVRVNPNYVRDLIHSGRPSPPDNPMRQAAAGHYAESQDFAGSPYYTVNHLNTGYRYVALIEHYASGNMGGNEDTTRVNGLTVEYWIREASGVY